MRILVVTDNRFWRGQFGSQRRIWSLCEHLTQHGHDVRILFHGFVYPVEAGQYAKAAIYWNIKTLGEPRPVIRAASAIGAGSAGIRIRHYVKQLYFGLRRSFQPKQNISSHVVRDFRLQQHEPKLSDFEDPELLSRFQHTCVEFQPEVILVEFVRLSFLLNSGRDAIPKACITMVDTHDIQYERQSRFHQRGEIHDIDISPAEEASALSYADFVIAIQAIDALKLLALLPGKAIVVAGFPNAIYKHPLCLSESVKIGFIGSSMSPNLHAATTLIKQHFPRLRRMYGETVELHIFGNVSDSIRVPAESSGIFLHGFVEDLTVAYGGLDIIANPVHFGGGLKIKNVEALCHGRSLLTTTIGAEGMEDGIGSAFCVSDSDDGFSEALEMLVRDSGRRVVLGNAALVYAEKHFSDAAVFRDFDKALAGEFSNVS